MEHTIKNIVNNPFKKSFDTTFMENEKNVLKY